MSTLSQLSPGQIRWTTDTLTAAGLRRAERPRVTVTTVAPLKTQLSEDLRQLDRQLGQLTEAPEYQTRKNDLIVKRRRLADLQDQTQSPDRVRAFQAEAQLDPLRAEIQQLQTRFQPTETEVTRLTAARQQVQDRADLLDRYVADNAFRGLPPELQRAADHLAERENATQKVQAENERQLREQQAEVTRQVAAVTAQLGPARETLRIAAAFTQGRRERLRTVAEDEFPGTHRLHREAVTEGEARERAAQATIDELTQKATQLEERSRQLTTQQAQNSAGELSPRDRARVERLAADARAFRTVQTEIDRDRQQLATQVTAAEQAFDELTRSKNAAAATLERVKLERPSGSHSDAVLHYQEQIARAQRTFAAAKAEQEAKAAEVGRLRQARTENETLARAVNTHLAATSFEGAIPELAARVDQVRDQVAEQARQELIARFPTLGPAASAAQARATAANTRLGTATAELERQTQATPELSAAATLAAQHQATLQERRGLQTRAEALVHTLRERYDTLRQQINEAAAADRVGPVSELSAALARLSAAADAAQQLKASIRTAEQQASTSRQSLDAAVAAHIQATPDSPLRALHTQVTDTGRLARQADDDRVAAEAELRQAQTAREQVSRREAVTEQLPRARAAVQALTTDFQELRDVPIWNAGGSEAIRTRLGAVRFAEFNRRARAFYFADEQLAQNGATTEERNQLFDDVPDLWKPPRLRAEEQNWRALQDWFGGEDVEQQQRAQTQRQERLVEARLTELRRQGQTITEQLRTKVEDAGRAAVHIGSAIATALPALSQVESASNLASGVMTSLGSDRGQAITRRMGLAPLDPAQSQSLGRVVTLIGVSCGQLRTTGRTVGAVRDAAAVTDAAPPDPIEQMMIDQEVVDALGGLARSGVALTGELLKALWQELPGLGVAVSASKAMQSLAEMAERLTAAQEDRRLQEEAARTEHGAEAALDHMATRGSHLAARAGTDAAIAAITAAAGVATLSGAGAAVGVGLRGVAAVGKAARTVGAWVVDRQEKAVAKELLHQAQAGNAHARGELFRHHPRYAKGILAVMATEGDALALACLNNHGLTEDMIRQSSPQIIKRYLMRRFGDREEPGPWSNMWSAIKTKLTTWATGAYRTVSTGLSTGWNELEIAVRADSPAVWHARLTLLRNALPALDGVVEAVGIYRLARSQYDALAGSLEEGNAEQVVQLRELETLVQATRRLVEELRTQVSRSNDALATLLGKIETVPRTSTPPATLAPCATMAQDMTRRHVRLLDLFLTAL